ncbi:MULTISPECIES: GNAT family N-acetyltransferase [unclassified Paracoccus (in: a-proteobacteria)]|uniref:GNAT family N-acetyltransferase n=1 Tax=unclassified Paracoccus (in: a-proteobacteria) TaxID=2688777 RepID=UPI00160015D5|nr:MULTISPECIES: GNAT family N-acetyltransferase [unclassified Paracoccus (in: a-proteobacteria)]MBB1491700.1 GNAT family N-acetyltransferase [Paracoccus sp. MC1854]MBB1499242.1 GNAT family N-acetyltransferase [Paracoccus sp. MC1862]QQO44872.1 GNAT family N-acetyltransferase [Paracoccus sp. MC1862]
MKICVTDDIPACFAIRRRVFIEEQNVPEEIELDEHDATAVHLLATQDERPVGTARLLIDGGTAKIGRVALLPEARGTGAGAALMRAALDELRARGVRTAKLGAQTYAIGFYEKLGFAAYGPEYDDAGIPHRDMSLTL